MTLKPVSAQEFRLVLEILNAATDGTDLGADISTILSETAGVY